MQQPSDKQPRVDLSKLAEGLDIEIKAESPETPAETDARLRIEDLQARHELRKDLIQFVVFLLVLVATTMGSLWILLFQQTDVESRKWAATVLTMIISGGVGYLTGKKLSGPSDKS